MILLLDCYDSFTWNLWHALASLGARAEVVRCDAEDAAALAARRPRAVVLSPGPGRPEQAGALLPLLDALPPATPVLGVCLGHQALAVHGGGRLERDPVPVHGKDAPVRHDGTGLYAGLPQPFRAGRYHSLRVRRDALPRDYLADAWAPDGELMGMRHRRLPRYGVQFHPESVLTPAGPRLLANFLTAAGLHSRASGKCSESTRAVSMRASSAAVKLAYLGGSWASP